MYQLFKTFDKFEHRCTYSICNDYFIKFEWAEKQGKVVSACEIPFECRIHLNESPYETTNLMCELSSTEEVWYYIGENFPELFTFLL